MEACDLNVIIQIAYFSSNVHAASKYGILERQRFYADFMFAENIIYYNHVQHRAKNITTNRYPRLFSVASIYSVIYIAGILILSYIMS